jgi:hypothetical protein
MATVYNMPAGEIAELLKSSDESITEDSVKEAIESAKTEDGMKTFLEKDKARVSSLKKAGFDDGHKKASKEALTALEKEAKEKFGIADDLKGLELIEAIHSLNREAPKKGEVTDDDVKKSKLFIDLQESFKKGVEEKENEWKSKFEQRESEYKRKEVFSTVKDKGLTIFESLNPVLSENADIAANQKNLIVNALDGYDYQFQDERIVVLDKEGKIIEDAHGNRVEFSDLVKTVGSKFFDFKVGPEKKFPNNKDEKKPLTFTVPKSSDEFVKLINNPDLSYEDRKAIIDQTPDEIKRG